MLGYCVTMRYLFWVEDYVAVGLAGLSRLTGHELSGVVAIGVNPLAHLSKPVMSRLVRITWKITKHGEIVFHLQ